MISCNGDCFNCPYPDVPEECLSAPLTEQERVRSAAEEIERIKHMPLPKELKQKRIHYWENREEILKKRREKRNENIGASRAYIREYQRNYRAENKRKYGAVQKKIAQSRKRRGWTQAGLAQMIGVSECTVRNWENSHSRANWDLLVGVFPELKKYRP